MIDHQKDFISSDQKKHEYPFQVEANQKLKTFGIPTRKDEHYSYFSLKKLLSKSFLRSDTTLDKVENLPEGIVCDYLTNVYTDYKLLIDSHYKKLVKNEKDFFALLSYSFVSNPLFIYVPKNTEIENPIDLHALLGDKSENQSYFSNVLIFLGKGAKLNLNIKTQETQTEENLFSRVVSTHLDEKAVLKIESDLTEVNNTWHFDSFRATLKKEAKLFFVSGSLGGHSLRQDFQVDLEGELSEVSLKGLQILKDKKSAYNHICVTHKAENCLSNQHFKQVVYNGGKGVFEGKIFVESVAQQTNAYQLCNSLTLGESAEVFAKPNLEIFADDVKASHGVTISKLKNDEIFYLLSRGLEKKEAEKFLIEGFCREITDNFTSKSVKYLIPGA